MGFDKSVIANAYKTKNIHAYEEAIVSCSRDCANSSLLGAYLLVLFYGAEIQHECEAFLLPMFSSFGLMSFFIRKHLDIELSLSEHASFLKWAAQAKIKIVGGRAYIQRNIVAGHIGQANTQISNVAALLEKQFFHTQIDYRALLKFFMQFEEQYEEIVEQDKAFFIAIFKLISSHEREEIMSNSPSPILLAISEGMTGLGDIFSFCRLEGKDKVTKFVEGQKLNYQEIKSIIFESSSQYLQARIRLFYEVYPELALCDMYVFRRRAELLENVYAIPQRGKCLRTYVPVISEMLSLPLQRTIEIKLFYINSAIEKGNKKLIKGVADLWISESTDVFMSVFSPANIEKIKRQMKFCIDHLPSITKYFDEINGMVKTQRDACYEALLAHVLRKYPKKLYFNIIKDNILYYSSGLIKEFKPYIVESELKRAE
ncbi:hypothetical protein ENBRE01_0237 [Enteropsectra breve]|nr:hypothetical protein ENBRE01_0237 [Enteropsectra breve]